MDVFFPNAVPAYLSLFLITNCWLERKRNEMLIAKLRVAFDVCNPHNVCKKNSRSTSFFIPGWVTITLRIWVLSDLSSVIFEIIGSGSPWI